jgi:hypothetical protein
MAGEKRAGAAVRALLVAAADRLTRAGKAEFTEWELTVAAWQADPARFGLPGFEAAHPDHKRVSCELVAGRRRSLLGDGWLERRLAQGLEHARREGDYHRAAADLKNHLLDGFVARPSLSLAERNAKAQRLMNDARSLGQGEFDRLMADPDHVWQF